MHKIPLSRVCILVGFLVLANVCQGKDTWEALDECLSKKNISLEPENGMLAILDMYGSPRKFCRPSSPIDKTIIGALQTFKQLNGMADLPLCEKTATEWRLEFVNVPSIKNSVRLSAIVNHYVRKASRNCQAYYANKFSVLEILDNPKRKLVRWFLREHIATTLIGDERRSTAVDEGSAKILSDLLRMIQDGPLRFKLVDKFILHEQPLANEVTAEKVYQVLDSYVQNNREDKAFAADNLLDLGEGTTATNPERIGKLFADLIYGLCEMHLQLFSKYFVEARADLVLLEMQDIIDLDGPRVDPFYIAWAEQNICKQIVSEAQERDKLIGLTKQVAARALESAKQSVKREKGKNAR